MRYLSKLIICLSLLLATKVNAQPTPPGVMSIGGSVRSGTSSSVLFVDSNGKLAQDNTNLFWNDASNYFGIRTNTPQYPLHVVGNAFLGSSTETNLTLDTTDEFSATHLNFTNQGSGTAAYFEHSPDNGTFTLYADEEVFINSLSDILAQVGTSYLQVLPSSASLVGSGNSITISSSNINLAAGTGDSITVNDAGADVDFRIESDGNANMVVVDGGLNGVGIGTTPTTGYALDVEGSSRHLGGTLLFNDTTETIYMNGNTLPTLGGSVRLNAGYTLFGYNMRGNPGDDTYRHQATYGAGVWGYTGLELRSGTTGGVMIYSSADATTAGASFTPTLVANFSPTDIIFNEPGNDVNFRVEGDTNANLINLDAGLDAIGFGVAPTADYGTYTAKTFTDTGSVFKYAARFTGTASPSGASSAAIGGLYATTAINGSANNTGNNAALTFQAFNSNTATTSTMIGVAGQVYNLSTGTLTSATGGQFQIYNSHASGTINTAYTVFAASPSATGAIGTTYGFIAGNMGAANITNAYGLYISEQTGAATTNRAIHVAGGDIVFNEVGGNYDLRAEGDTDTNLFFLDASADSVGIGTNAPTQKLDINSDSFRLRTAKTPSSATDTGTQGQIAWDANYIYICTATNTWKRSAIATW